MEYMVTAIQDMCSGEIIQAHQLFTAKVSEENYFERINKKPRRFYPPVAKQEPRAQMLQMQI